MVPTWVVAGSEEPASKASLQQWGYRLCAWRWQQHNRETQRHRVQTSQGEDWMGGSSLLGRR